MLKKETKNSDTSDKRTVVVCVHKDEVSGLQIKIRVDKSSRIF